MERQLQYSGALARPAGALYIALAEIKSGLQLVASAIGNFR